jgi:hypothetical protein
MTTYKKTKRGRRVASTTNRSTARHSSANPAPPETDPLPPDQILESGLSLHQLFEQQTRAMLDRTDLDEEQKQNVLVAMSCPCCGAGAMSYTVKLKR